MPRRLRVEYPGAIYHVMSRANGKGNIFEGNVDRHDFIKTLAETCEKTGFQAHAYCLMSNHFHLVVETPNGNLVAGMRWFLPAAHEEGREPEDWKAIRRGWCLGTPEFKAELMERIAGKLREHPSGAMQAESAAARAEKIIFAELKRQQWTERDLREQPKSTSGKLAIAARLKRETTLTLPAIAKRLDLGSWKSASSKIHHWRKSNEVDQKSKL